MHRLISLVLVVLAALALFQAWYVSTEGNDGSMWAVPVLVLAAVVLVIFAVSTARRR